ncbi:MAG: hypothetical protein IJO88_06215 [Oscillospiraceae bacterium]|nr:hypothetical protein [Oscillospiraceae bacterium]
MSYGDRKQKNVGEEKETSLFQKVKEQFIRPQNWENEEKREAGKPTGIRGNGRSDYAKKPAAAPVMTREEYRQTLLLLEKYHTFVPAKKRTNKLNGKETIVDGLARVRECRMPEGMPYDEKRMRQELIIRMERLQKILEECRIRTGKELQRREAKARWIHDLNKKMLSETGLLALLCIMLENADVGNDGKLDVYSGYFSQTMEELEELYEQSNAVPTQSTPQTDCSLDALRSRFITLQMPLEQTPYEALFRALRDLRGMSRCDLRAWAGQVRGLLRSELKTLSDDLCQDLEQEYPRLWEEARVPQAEAELPGAAEDVEVPAPGTDIPDRLP